jgi:hypothetical protein
MTEAVLEQQQEVAIVSPSGRRNANKEKIAKEEAEIQELKDLYTKQRETEASYTKQVETSDEKTTAVESVAEPEDAEERSFKKRYGDLRRHSQEQQSGLQKQIDALQSQLKQSTEQQIHLPKSEEELNQWAENYPDVAKIVETIAIKKAREQSFAIEERLKSLDEREKASARSKAEAELMTIHPDFASIRDSDEFHDWVEEQPKWVQSSLYENDTDSRAASRAIDLYKADKGISKNKKDGSYKEAAQSIVARNTKSSPTDQEGNSFSESQVDRMSTREYEQNQEAIAKAMKSGKFLYDISGNAR